MSNAVAEKPKVKKLTVVQDLERQLEVVALGEWVTGDPQKFQQACLVIRTDAKEEITRKVMLVDEVVRLVNAGVVWSEGYRVYRVAESHDLSKQARQYVAQARQRLGYFLKPSRALGQAAADMTRNEREDRTGVATRENNIAWNDHVAKKGQAQEVLMLALQLAEEAAANRRKARAAKKKGA